MNEKTNGVELVDFGRNKRKLEKELKSFKKKLNTGNLIWFESLKLRQQYNILFIWKNYKYLNKLDKPKIVSNYNLMDEPTKKFVFSISSFSTIVKDKETGRSNKRNLNILYPVSFKFFISYYRDNIIYQPDISDLRSKQIDYFLNEL